MAYQIREVAGRQLEVELGLLNNRSTVEKRWVVTTSEIVDQFAVTTAVANQLGVYPGATYSFAGTFDDAKGVASLRVTQRSDSPYVWDVSATYSDEYNVDPDLYDLRPWERPVDIVWSTAEVEDAIEEDVDGEPIVNAAGDPFDPPYTRQRVRKVVTLTRNERFFQPSQLDYKETLNKEEFLGLPAKTCKMVDIRAQLRLEGRARFWQVTYTVHIDEKEKLVEDDEGELVSDDPPNYIGWKARLLNIGLNEVVGGVKRPIFLQGQRVQVPQLLDADGARQDIPNVAAQAIFLEFDVIPTKDWTPLGLPLPEQG